MVVFRIFLHGITGLIKSNVADITKYINALLNKSNRIYQATLFMEKVYYKDENLKMGLELGIMPNCVTLSILSLEILWDNL